MRSERLAIHPYMLTMRFARCPAAAQDASQRTTDGVFQVCGGQWGRLVLVGAQLQTGPPRRPCRRCGPRSQTHGCASSGARYGGSWRAPGPMGVVGSAACGWLLLDACRLLRVVTCLGCPDRGTLSVPPAGAAVARVQPPKLWSESVGFHKAIICEHVVGLGTCPRAFDDPCGRFKVVPR